MLNIKNNAGKISISRTSEKIERELDRLNLLSMIHLSEARENVVYYFEEGKIEGECTRKGK